MYLTNVANKVHLWGNFMTIQYYKCISKIITKQYVLYSEVQWSDTQ
jgi:hypothetical protein